MPKEKQETNTVQDHDKALTASDVAKIVQAQEEFKTANEVVLSGVVIGSYLTPTEKKPVLDRETKEHKKDENGEYRYYPQREMIKIAFTGGEYDFEKPKGLEFELEFNQTYKFIGRVASVKEFGTVVVRPVFHSVEKAPAFGLN